MRPLRLFLIVVTVSMVLGASGALADVMWWNYRYGDAHNDYGASVASDADGNVIVTGAFADSIDFGGGVLASAGSWDIFVAKFDPEGNHIWSHRYGSTDADEPVAVATDPSGNVFVLGTFQRTVDFGGGPLTSTGGILADVFLAKYSAATGAHLWSKRFGGSEWDTAGGLAVDDIGRSVITGGFTGTTDFGGGPVTASGFSDVFVAKYSPAGNYVWSKALTSSSTQVGYGVAVDASYNVIVTGEFWNEVDLGGGVLTSSGNTDIFVAKYTITGNHVWSARYGINSVSLNNDPQSGRTVAVDAAGNIIVSGDFVGSVNFGGGVLSCLGNASDVFVAKLDPNGAHIWSRSFGGPAEDHVHSVAVGPDSSVVVVGSFQETADFGGGPVSSNSNSQDIFFARYNSAGGHVWSGGFGDAYDSDQASSVAFGPDGGFLMTGRFKGALDFGRLPHLASDGGANTDVFVAKFNTQVTGIGPRPYPSTLSPPHPNPFNPATRVDYFVAREGRVRLTVHDVSGRLVAVLVDQVKGSGDYTAEWNASHVSSGVYFLRLDVAGNSAVRKAVLLK